MDPHYYEFVWLPTFEQMAGGLFTEEHRRKLEQLLLTNPESGALLEGTGGFRKLRIALEGRGKSAGARVIYFFSERRGRIYPALIYAKSKQESLTDAQRWELRQLARILKGES